MTGWLRYLIAFVVASHASIYLVLGPYFFVGKEKRWRGSFWMLDGAVSGEVLRGLVLVLHLAAGITILVCAVAIVFAPSIPGWWRPLGVVGGALGLAAFAAFWDGQGELLAQEGAIGAAVSSVLLAAAIAFPAAFE